MKHNVLYSLVRSDSSVQKEYDKRTGKTTYYVSFKSKVNELFNELRTQYYKDGKKIITSENISKLDWLGLAIKYFDDGYYKKGAGAISMNNYSLESVEVFRNHLLHNFNIKTTMQKDKTIYIPKSEFKQFKNNIFKYATADVLYKLGELQGTPDEDNLQVS